MPDSRHLLAGKCKRCGDEPWLCAKPLTPLLAQRITSGAPYLESALAVITAEKRLPIHQWSVDIPYEPVDPHGLEALAVRWGVEKYVAELLQAALG